MSDTPRTVFYCETHRSEASHAQPPCHYSVMKLMQIHPEEIGGCRMVEFELHPVGTQEKLDRLGEAWKAAVSDAWNAKRGRE